jgi:hypothetical protein
MGKKVGETAEFEAPKGKIVYKIASISWQDLAKSLTSFVKRVKLTNISLTHIRTRNYQDGQK